MPTHRIYATVTDRDVMWLLARALKHPEFNHRNFTLSDADTLEKLARRIRDGHAADTAKAAQKGKS